MGRVGRGGEWGEGGMREMREMRERGETILELSPFPITHYPLPIPDYPSFSSPTSIHGFFCFGFLLGFD
jgi:hypothetical protein